MVRIKIEPLASVITICNYEEYQLKPAAIEPLANHSRTRLNKELPPLPPADESLSALALRTADRVFEVFGFTKDTTPERWCGLGRWLDAGMRGGWKPELIVQASRGVARRRKNNPPGSFHYLQGPINEAHQAPIVQTTAPAPGRQLALVTTVSNGEGSNGTDWKSRRDAGHRAYEKLKAFAAELETRERDEETDGSVSEPQRERS